MRRLLYILFLLSCGLFSTYAQKYNLKISSPDDIVNKLNYKKQFDSETERDKELNNVLQWLYGKGYITAGFDSITKDSVNMSAYINTGNKYTLAHLKQGNISDVLLSETGYKEKFYSNKTFNYEEISILLERILIYCENNGFPFATVKLDSIRITNDSVSASLNLNHNKKIYIDSIIVKGNARISEVYLSSYLGIKADNIYDESQISRIDLKLSEIQFIKETRPPEIRFTKDKADIYLYLDKRKSNQFNGILGLLPNNKTTGKLLLTGDVNLKLINSFGRGELFDFNWRKTGQNTQDLKSNFFYPYILSTPFGIDYKFLLYKKDTTYITLNNNLGVQYIFKGNNYIKAFWEGSKSSLLSTNGLKYLTILPSFADISANLYGLEVNNENLDYRFNPRKGFMVILSAAAGNKQINKNSNIDEPLYNNIDLITTQYKINSDISFFIPLFKTSTVLFNLKAAYLGNSVLFENELFKIGGLKTLRGFDEESINASLYSIIDFEYRYIFERNSYMCLFWNGAYYENNSYNKFLCDRPYGFGAGLNFETKAGIFSIYYALGKEFGNPIYLKSAKIHFGITNYF